MFAMIIPVSTKPRDVININIGKFILTHQNTGHESLEVCLGIQETKGHHIKPKFPKQCEEGGFVSLCFLRSTW